MTTTKETNPFHWENLQVASHCNDTLICWEWKKMNLLTYNTIRDKMRLSKKIRNYFKSHGIYAQVRYEPVGIYVRPKVRLR